MKSGKKEKEPDLTFNGLAFEELLEDLLKIKPVESSDLKKIVPKKKRKPTKK